MSTASAAGPSSDETANDLAKHARSAMQRKDWPAALAYWDKALAALPSPRDNWKVSRADVLHALRRYREAENELSDIANAQPDNPRVLFRLVRSIIGACRSESNYEQRRSELLRYLDREPFRDLEEDGPFHKVAFLTLLGEVSLARPELVRNVKQADTLKKCEMCFDAIPVLIERGDRAHLWLDLLSSVRGLPGEADSGRTAVIELRLLVALERFDEFMQRYDVLHDQIKDDRYRLIFGAVRRRVELPRLEVFNEPKVFGIGLAKTATSSLSDALTLLGIDNGHWTNPLTNQILSDVDFFMLGGACDTSASQNFEKLFYQYPNARFILTQRRLDDWVRSMTDHYAINTGRTDIEGMRQRIGRSTEWRHGFESVAIHAGLYLHHDGLEQAYAAHERRVRNFFLDKPSGRLLEFNVFEGDGWPKLCEVLERPLPETGFPWKNRRARDSGPGEPSSGSA